MRVTEEKLELGLVIEAFRLVSFHYYYTVYMRKKRLFHNSVRIFGANLRSICTDHHPTYQLKNLLCMYV